MDKGYLVALVGPCGSGKSTIAGMLTREGVPAREVGQEHTAMPYYFLEIMPRLVVYLEVELEDIRRRKGAPDWPQQRLDRQRRHLAYARKKADLKIDSSSAAPQDIVPRIMELLSRTEPALLRVPQDVSTLGEAVRQAPEGATILLDQGTYRENVVIENRDLTLSGLNPGLEDSVRLTQVTARSRGSVITVVGGQVRIQGLTITGGTGLISPGEIQGGGMTVRDEARVWVSRCRLMGNTTEADGGGLLVEDSLVTITRSFVGENQASGEGGGLALVSRSGMATADSETTDPVMPARAYDTTYAGGGEATSDLRGEGERPPIIPYQVRPVGLVTHSTISGNRSAGSGGGIYITGTSPRVENNVIESNQALRGGGIMTDDGSRSTISGNLLKGNRACSEGGGLCCGWGSSPAVEANSFEDNTAPAGQGVFMWAGSSARLRRNRLEDDHLERGHGRVTGGRASAIGGGPR